MKMICSFLLLVVFGLMGCTQGSVDSDQAIDDQSAENEIVGPAFVLFYTEN